MAVAHRSSGNADFCAADGGTNGGSITVLFALTAIVACEVLAAGAPSGVRVVPPVAVPLASGPAYPRGHRVEHGPDSQYAAEKAIDGDPATFSCLLDDTCNGESLDTIPPRAAAPVTGHMVFDLGRPMLVLGVRLTSRQSPGVFNPHAVDFYFFRDDDPQKHPVADDLEHDDGLRPLVRNHQFPRLSGGASASVLWDGVVARFIGMRVNSSFECGGKHFNFQIGELAFFAGTPLPGAQTGDRAPPLYIREPTLTATLVAGRQRYAARFGGQPANGPAGEIQRAACEDFWRQVERDFPLRQHRFLAEVHHTWFAPDGWLGTGAVPQFERNRADDLPDPASRDLDVCQTAVEQVAIARAVRALRQAIEDLRDSFPGRYDGAGYLRRLAEIAARGSAPGNAEAIWTPIERLKYDALVAGNPLLSPGRLLFVKRYTYTPGWYYAEFMRATRMGGGLFVLSLPDGAVRELLPELRGGLCDRFDLSFDGRRVVFAYKNVPEKGFRLYEANTDGTGLRQLTHDPPDEPQRVARYALPGSPYRHTSDDFHPCYLPDGGVAFASARCERGVLCDQGGDLAVNLVYRLDADGGNLRRLSEGALSESTPSVTNDGRILYTRWEYVDKGVIAVQSLWTMRPDGSGSEEAYGNVIEDPMVFIHGRSIPGDPHRLVCTGTFHHPFAVGPILLIDTRKPLGTLEPIQSLTPDTAASSRLHREQTGSYGEKFAHRRNGRWVLDNCGPLFSEPWPLADPQTNAGAGKYFLVNCNPDQPWGHPSAYGLYLIDVFGNRVRIYSDPQISCWQPVPLGPRLMPPVLPLVAERAVANAAGAKRAAGNADGGAVGAAERVSENPAETTLSLVDVYRGLEGVPRGTVKYLRVLEQVPRPWAAQRFWPDDTWGGQHAPISMFSHIHVKIHHGVVPVQPDGSAHFTVPAQRNLFFQALDAHFQEVQRMRSFVNLQPGENRSCIGCHEGRGPAPPHNARPLAFALPPSALAPQPGETVPRAIHYPTDVQPVFDRHCVKCHGKDRADGGLDLSAEATAFFCRSYEALMSRKLVSYVTEFYGPSGSEHQFTNVQPLPPRAVGSSASKLFRYLGADHYGATLTEAERVRLSTWADANAPYYGTYFGRRNLKYKDAPDFRPLPALVSAKPH